MTSKVWRRGSYIILLCFAFQATAQRTSCARNFDSELRFYSPDPRAVAEFAQAARAMGEKLFDGSIAPPAGLLLDSQNEKYFREFTVGSIRDQSKDLRRLFRDVLHRSRLNDPETAREFGAVILEYVDGRTIVVKFTSNRVDEIVGSDVLKAINHAADHSEPLAKMLVIHSHPILANAEGEVPTICPSTEDYDFLHILQRSWEHMHKHGEVEVEGIVLPGNASCADVFFRFYPGGLFEHSDAAD